jgi:hypothetical protein
MDWTEAIARHRDALLRIVAGLFAMAGLTAGGAPERLPRPLHRAVLAVLRPAEAAVRRLIVLAAHGLVVKPRPLRPLPRGLRISGTGRAAMAFRLFDPRRRLARADRRRAGGPRPGPRIRIIDAGFDPRIALFRPARPDPTTPPAAADDTVSARPLSRRLAAIRAALEDLPRQARRLARWRARPIEKRRPRYATPLRPGGPPGLGRITRHEVETILANCHWLARDALAPDTS